MKLNAANLGIRIKQARVAKGWTQTELARALGVQRSSVVRWETGISVARNIPKVAALLGQSPEWFLEHADEVNVTAAVSESQELKQLRAEVRRLQKELRSVLSHEGSGTEKTHAKSVIVNIINDKNDNTQAVIDEKVFELQKPAAQQQPENIQDQAVLADLLKDWNSVSSEARLMAALLITGDWSYKLKLWNRNVAVGEEVLKAVRRKKPNETYHSA
jgi:transcriptional regulator with XRE-family HTH domain